MWDAEDKDKVSRRKAYDEFEAKIRVLTPESTFN